MAKYNITRIVPEAFMHSSGFLEVIDSLAWSLAALGHEVNVTQNWLSEHGETNIVFGAELMADFQRLPPSTIIYNLEQPSHPNMTKVRLIAKQSSAVVWDYSRRAVDEWRGFGHERVFHVPIGYTPNLTRIPKSESPDIDVFFVGWMTPRRVELITALRLSGLKVVASAACYGGGRDNYISRSKILLNVHHDGRDRFEIVRCSYYMANSAFVLTEPSSDADEYTSLERGLYVCPIRAMTDTCQAFAHSLERNLIAERGFSLIRQRDYTAAVAAALDSTPPAPAIRTHHMDLARRKIDYMKQGRALADQDQRVSYRLNEAAMRGDMKDFVVWMRDHACGNILEIGVRDGASTSAFLRGVETNGGHVYSIDIADCSHLFKGHPQWTFIHGASYHRSVISRTMGMSIDVLLIDGDHSLEGVKSDFEIYAPLVKPGGLILFHDIRPEPNPGNVPDWPDDSVKNFYTELCSTLGWEHEELPGRYGMGVLHKPSLVAQPQ